MHWLFALAVTVGVWVLSAGLGGAMGLMMGMAGVPTDLIRVQARIVGALVPFISCVWVYFDAKAIEFHKYQGFVSGSPLAIAGVCVLFWIVAFPAYLQKRWKITHGQAQLKTQA
jgi:hypothetical protein